MHLTYEVYEILTQWMILMGFYLLGRISNVKKINEITEETIEYMELYKEQLLVEKELLSENQDLILTLKQFQDLNNRLQHALFDANNRGQ